MKKTFHRWARIFWMAAISGLASQVSAKELVMAEIHPPGHIIVKAEELFASRLAELTKGEVSVQLKHSAQLGNENQSWENVRKGTVDVVRINLGGMVKDIGLPAPLAKPRKAKMNISGCVAIHTQKLAHGD